LRRSARAAEVGTSDAASCAMGRRSSAPASAVRVDAAHGGGIRPAKPRQSIGVPTSRRSCGRSPGARACGVRPDRSVAPFWPDVFPMERRSRYETRVYVDLCPFSVVDTARSTDTLRKGKKGLKTNEFRDSQPSGVGLGRAVGAARGALEARGERGDRRTGPARIECPRAGSSAGAAGAPGDEAGQGASAGRSGTDDPGGPIGRCGAREATWRSWPGGGIEEVMVSSHGRTGCVEVLDLGALFRQRRGSSAIRAPKSSAPLFAATRPARTRPAPEPAEGMRRMPRTGGGYAGALPAQALHSSLAVDRFHSSSPHRVAGRGNQEKMR